MKFKISPSMKKCIKETQLEALKLFPTIPFSHTKIIRKKPTKKKVFDFHIFNFGIPRIKLYINKRLYKEYFYKDKWWQEMKE